MSVETTIVILGLLSLLTAFVFLRQVIKQDPTKGIPKSQAERMVQISGAISLGSQAFLKREFRHMLVFIIGFGLLVFLVVDFGSAFSFAVGAFCSIGAGWLGMRAATEGNIRTAVAARRSLRLAFRRAFQSGAVMGFGLVGIALLGLIIMYLLYKPFIKDTRHLMEAIAGFALGGSSIALFARVGGGIFTKAADMSADLVGKIEQNIPEDDPRNPAVIADNVGDNVGDVAGMGADLFGSITESTCAALVIGATIFSTELALLYPITLTAFGVPVALVVAFFVRANTARRAESALKFSLFASTVLMAFVTLIVTLFSLPEEFVIGVKNISRMGVYLSVLSGLLSGLLIGIVTEFYTSSHKRPVREIASASRTGAATNIVIGMALGHRSSVIPVILLGITVFIGFSAAGMYGIALSAIGMLGAIIMTLTIDAFGPVADNAGGIAQMASMDSVVRRRTDALDAAGNTTAAVGKGFAIGSAALTSLALIFAFLVRSGIDTLDILKPSVISLLVIGAMLPFSFTSMMLRAVGRTAKELINESRRQFATIPGLKNVSTEEDDDGEEEETSTVLPNYRRCVDIATKSALRNMIVPAIQVLLVPLAVGFLFGVEPLAGLLIGSLASGVVLATSSVNAGGAWDNAKKLIEQGHLGGKGSDAHAAAVIGDTVGDPLKDTSGPSLNILIKLQAIVSLVFAHSFGEGLFQVFFG